MLLYERGIGMGYEISLSMAWKELNELALPQICSLSLLTNTYEIRIAEKAVLLQPSGIRADEGLSVLILRYLIGRSKRGFHPYGEWISFKETDGGKLFWPNFSNRAIKPLVECFKQDPNGTIQILMENLGGRKVEGGDVAIEVETFPGVFVRILFWRGDEELPPAATMLFDRGLTEVYIMEDVAVLLTLVAETISKMVHR
jgi:hypothetical protein